MSAPLARRERIARLGRLGFVANRAAQDLAAVEPVPMPLDLAQRVRALAEAARDVASMVERELGFLEAARDWAEGDAPSSDPAARRAP